MKVSDNMITVKQKIYNDTDYVVNIIDDNNCSISLNYNSCYDFHNNSDCIILQSMSYFWSVGTTCENVKQRFNDIIQLDDFS